MDTCIVIIFCNCVQNFCSATGHISVYLYICTWPLTINFADIPIYILSWVWVKLSWVGNKYVTVFEWYRRFCDGSRSLGDEKGPGRNGSAFSRVATLVIHVSTTIVSSQCSTSKRHNSFNIIIVVYWLTSLVLYERCGVFHVYKSLTWHHVVLKPTVLLTVYKFELTSRGSLF